MDQMEQNSNPSKPKTSSSLFPILDSYSKAPASFNAESLPNISRYSRPLFPSVVPQQQQEMEDRNRIELLAYNAPLPITDAVSSSRITTEEGTDADAESWMRCTSFVPPPPPPPPSSLPPLPSPPPPPPEVPAENAALVDHHITVDTDDSKRRKRARRESVSEEVASVSSSSSSLSDSDSDDRKRSRKRSKEKKRHHKSDRKRDKKDKKRKRDRERDDRREEKQLRKTEKQKIFEFEFSHITKDPRKGDKLVVSGSSLSGEIPFASDTKGDRNNLLFGALYKLDVPQYLRLNKDDPHREYILKWRKKRREMLQGIMTYEPGVGFVSAAEEDSSHAPLDRYYKGKIAQKQRDYYMKRIHAPHGKRDMLGLPDEFIPLDEEGSAKPPPPPPQRFSLLEHEEKQADEYERAAKKGSANQQLDGSNKEEPGESFEDYVYRRTREFNEAVRSDPYNVQLWLSFVAFQDEANKVQKRASHNALIEKKVAIYKKALEHNPTSIELLCGLLTASREIEPRAKMEELWTSALNRVPDSVQLWTEYIQFKKSFFSEFSVSSIRETFAKALRTFLNVKRSILEQVDEDEEQDDARQDELFAKIQRIEENMLQLFFDVCIFEQQCGYTERGIAAFQALVELNIFCPLFVTTWTAQLDSFKNFWASEAPRIGEQGAVGWKYWLMNLALAKQSPAERMQQQPPPPRGVKGFVSGGKMQEDSDDDEEEDEINEEILDAIDKVTSKEIFEKWVKEEDKRSYAQWLPCRPLKDAEIAETSPDRIVMFEDIKDYLFPITSSPRLQLELVFLFLEFLGVPIMYTQKSVNDMYVQESILNKQDSKHLFSVFNLEDYESKFDWKPQVPITDPLKRQFVNNVFTLAAKAFPNEKVLSLSYLDFGSQQYGPHTKQLARSLLEKERSNLFLWNAYAQIERKNGNLNEARKVYDTALSMLPTTTTTGGADEDSSNRSSSSSGGGSMTAATAAAPLLFRSYAEIELLHGNNRTNALHILCSCVEFEREHRPFVPLYASKKKKAAAATDRQHQIEVPATRLLKARKEYTQKLAALAQYSSGLEPTTTAQQQQQQQLGVLLEYVMCFALFEHITQGPMQACAIFEQAIAATKNWPKCARPHPNYYLQMRADTFTYTQTIQSLHLGDVHEQYLWLLFLRYAQLHVVAAGSSRPEATTDSSSSVLSTSSNTQYLIGPAKLRNILERFLERFPAHPLGLCLFIELENQTHVTYRMRRYFDMKFARLADSPIVYLMAIYAELSKPNSQNRVRSLFERAFEHASCRSNVMLWRMYIRFEVSQGKLSEAKSVFYRAVDKCVQSKALWMDSVKLLSDVLAVREIKDLCDIMIEKELFVRTFIQEIVLMEVTSSSTTTTTASTAATSSTTSS